MWHEREREIGREREREREGDRAKYRKRLFLVKSVVFSSPSKKQGRRSKTNDEQTTKTKNDVFRQTFSPVSVHLLHDDDVDVDGGPRQTRRSRPQLEHIRSQVSGILGLKNHLQIGKS